MSDKTITQLSELTTVTIDDILPIVDDPAGTPVTKKATSKNIVKGGASTGAVSALIDANLTASKALVSDASGKVYASSVSSTELGYLAGVTSAVQTQINGKSDTSHNHNGTYCRWRGVSTTDPTSPLDGDIYYN